jgi:hypothetical protein
MPVSLNQGITAETWSSNPCTRLASSEASCSACRTSSSCKRKKSFFWSVCCCPLPLTSWRATSKYLCQVETLKNLWHAWFSVQILFGYGSVFSESHPHVLVDSPTDGPSYSVPAFCTTCDSRMYSVCLGRQLRYISGHRRRVEGLLWGAQSVMDM